MSTNGNGHVGIARSTKLEDLPEWLTVDEFAAWAGLSRNGAYEAIRRGDVKVIRLGRLLRVLRSSLEELAR